MLHLKINVNRHGSTQDILFSCINHHDGNAKLEKCSRKDMFVITDHEFYPLLKIFGCTVLGNITPQYTGNGTNKNAHWGVIIRYSTKELMLCWWEGGYIGNSAQLERYPIGN